MFMEWWKSDYDTASLGTCLQYTCLRAWMVPSLQKHRDTSDPDMQAHETIPACSSSTVHYTSSSHHSACMCRAARHA